MLPHGFDTDAEWLAYEKGKKDHEQIMFDWIKKWLGTKNSIMGITLIEKFESLGWAKKK